MYQVIAESRYVKNLMVKTGRNCLHLKSARGALERSKRKGWIVNMSTGKVVESGNISILKGVL